MEVNVWLVILVQSALIPFLQFGSGVLPSNFAARKTCHAGSGALMLLLDSKDVVARCFVYLVVVTSLAMTWRFVPKWVENFRFGKDYDWGITCYLVIVGFWFYMQLPIRVLAPLFFADPAGAIVGKFFSKRGLNVVWWENKTVAGTAAVALFAYLSVDVPDAAARALMAVLCALAEAFGGQTFDNAVIAVVIIGGWFFFHA